MVQKVQTEWGDSFHYKFLSLENRAFRTLLFVFKREMTKNLIGLRLVIFFFFLISIIKNRWTIHFYF